MHHTSRNTGPRTAISGVQDRIPDQAHGSRASIPPKGGAGAGFPTCRVPRVGRVQGRVPLHERPCTTGSYCCTLMACEASDCATAYGEHELTASDSLCAST
ncbi:hypothetical protein GCM10022207_94870 [Streptomyces lannensis]|uniref:Uncharacterized protein n=1 Tax=Streptomyces lannensis TaxID=766498 RepID=A0ABP7M3A0_9ACTN